MRYMLHNVKLYVFMFFFVATEKNCICFAMLIYLPLFVCIAIHMTAKFRKMSL